MSGFDSGGINWKINLDDQFSRALQSLKSQLAEAQNTLKSFQGDKGAFDQQTASVRNLVSAIEALNGERANNQPTLTAKEEIAAQKELIAQTRQLAQVEKERGAIVRSLNSDHAKEVAATNQLADAQKKATASTANLNKEQAKTPAATKANTNALKSLSQALIDGGSAGNRLVFTLRNIIGVGAGLAFIQKIQGGFSDLVRSGISFNSEIESTTTGVAGLLTALLTIKDAQGNLVTGARAFSDTFAIARDQVDKLRQDTLRTTATFQELAKTFEVAVAPGLRAGLNFDQIRELSVNVAQAAAAIGLPANQLSEEIRALLTGTIQQRTTRIATALGITPDDIRKAKNDVGGLGKFLDDRFKAFELAGERAAGTFTGSFNRAKAAIGLVSGEAIKPLFEEIRTTFIDVFDLATTRDIVGKLVPKPEAIDLLQRVFNGIRDGLDAVVSTIKDLNFADVQASAVGLGLVFKGIGTIIAGFIQGAVDGFARFARVLDSVTGGIRGLDLTLLKNIANVIGDFVVSLGGIGVALGAIRLIVSTFILPLSEAVKAFRLLNTVADATILASPFIAGTVAAIGLAVGVQALIDLYTDLDRVAQASTAAAQLSKAAQIRQVIQDLRKQQEALRQDANNLEKNGDTQLADLQLTRARLLQQQIKDQEKLLALQEKSDKTNPAAGAPSNIQAPAFDENTFLNRIRDLANAAKDVFSTTLGGGTDVAAEGGGLFATIFPTELPAGLGTILDGLGIQIQDRLFSKPEPGAFEKLFEGMGDVLQGQLNLLRTAVTEFSSFVASSIVSAFDPTNDQSFQERFARFLQSIATQIISTLTQIAISKALLGLFGSSALVPIAGASGGGLVPGFAEGGEILSPAHYGIPASPPPGLDPSDTVPAWLAPGEFVQKARAVAMYGADLMERINAGLVDPMSLRALAGLGGHRASARNISRVAAFADGGLVSSQLAQLQRAQATAGASAPAGPAIAAVVGNDLALDRLLAGGKGAFLDFLRQHAPAVRANIGVGT